MPALRSVMSRVKATMWWRPLIITGFSRTSSQRRLPSRLRQCHSKGGQRPSRAWAMRSIARSAV